MVYISDVPTNVSPALNREPLCSLAIEKQELVFVLVRSSQVERNFARRAVQRIGRAYAVRHTDVINSLSSHRHARSDRHRTRRCSIAYRVYNERRRDDTGASQ